MEKVFNRLKARFGSAKPTVRLFDEILKTLPKEERDHQLYELCQLSFGYYEKLPVRYQKFIRTYFVHNRSCYLDYLTLHTPLNSLRYSLHHPNLFLKMLHLLETTERKTKISYLHLAICLLLVFDFPYKASTLSKYLRKKQHSAEEILQLAGKKEIYEDDFVDL